LLIAHFAVNKRTVEPVQEGDVNNGQPIEKDEKKGEQTAGD
jgi:hypothetical protein